MTSMADGFSISQFYGKSRILGPTNCWKIFYRQNEAFRWANQKAKDLLVFAFEHCYGDFATVTGKRRYLVTSLDVFWHYYSQLDPSQRHHYEIIPEGCPCHLYFDLEFIKEFNPGSDGDKMVDLLIKYVCTWLEAEFNIRCDRTAVLDLDASTKNKFSRHLIFHLPGAVFENCVHAGNFVRHIFGALLTFIKLKSEDLNINPLGCDSYKIHNKDGGSSPALTSGKLVVVDDYGFGGTDDEDELVAIAETCEEDFCFGESGVSSVAKGGGTSGDVCGAMTRGTSGDVCGAMTRGTSGDVCGAMTRGTSGDVCGAMTRGTSGDVCGAMTRGTSGDVCGAMTRGTSGDVCGAMTRGTSGDVCGALTRRTSGDVWTVPLSDGNNSDNCAGTGENEINSDICAVTMNEGKIRDICAVTVTEGENSDIIGQNQCYRSCVKSSERTFIERNVIESKNVTNVSLPVSELKSEVISCATCDGPNYVASLTEPTNAQLRDNEVQSDDFIRLQSCWICPERINLQNMDEASADEDSSYYKMMRFCGQFSLDDLKSLLVINGDGRRSLFCDLGVYTKNRNFRLYLSSKLNKNNPLLVSSHNQFRPHRTMDKISEEQALFNESLVSYRSSTSNLNVLTFGSRESSQNHLVRNTSPDICSISGSVISQNEGSLAGLGCSSPYPEIDGFIESVTSSHGCEGHVRQWTYFRSSDSLLYDIIGCRWCDRVGREHRSNNIMYVVDLRRGVFYQKCHDPDCQAAGYRSNEKEIPYHLLPSSYFDVDDEEDDDNLLLAAIEDMEFVFVQQEDQQQNLDNLRASDDDDDMVAVAEEVEMYFH